MQIVFVSNYINHHQIPVSDELYRLSDGNYTFIQTEPMEEERINMGWDADAVNKPYVKLFYEKEEECKKLMMGADAVIFGGTEREELIIPRLEAGKFTVRYSERLYKEGRWKFVSPKGLKKKHYDHTRFRESNVFLLCSGAYVAGDFELIGAYPKKKLKYGYFPEFIEYRDIDEKRGGNKKFEILWAARFIDWKHPEMMVELAKMIKGKGLNAHISMIGTGELLEATQKSAEGLSEYISFLGAKTPSEVREQMRASDMFISTSDRKEGWGAVINEAMNSGCVTVAARQIGAAPYLVKNGENGYMYEAMNTESLFRILNEIMDSKAKAFSMRRKAYETIASQWNANEAARRLYEFMEDPEHKICYKEGPLSRA